MTENQQQIVITKSTKNVGIALILTFIFGSIGMFYSTVKGGLIMILIQILFIVVTLGVGVFLVFLLNPICMIWAAISANNYNKQLLQGAA